MLSGAPGVLLFYYLAGTHFRKGTKLSAILLLTFARYMILKYFIFLNVAKLVIFQFGLKKENRKKSSVEGLTKSSVLVNLTCSCQQIPGQ